jgi:hypothetical protein
MLKLLAMGVWSIGAWILLLPALTGCQTPQNQFFHLKQERVHTLFLAEIDAYNAFREGEDVLYPLVIMSPPIDGRALSSLQSALVVHRGGSSGSEFGGSLPLQIYLTDDKRPVVSVSVAVEGGLVEVTTNVEWRSRTLMMRQRVGARDRLAGGYCAPYVGAVLDLVEEFCPEYMEEMESNSVRSTGLSIRARALKAAGRPRRRRGRYKGSSPLQHPESDGSRPSCLVFIRCPHSGVAFAVAPESGGRGSWLRSTRWRRPDTGATKNAAVPTGVCD